MDDEAHYRAIAGRDARYDGVLVYGVTTTGVYCRPSCPSRTPRPENVRYFAARTAAEAAGFRPCRRCRPQAIIGEAPDRLVRAASALIAEGLVDEIGVAGLATRLAVSERHLNRLLQAHLGITAQALAHARRTQVARLLLQETDMPISDVAHAAGFGSIRQFNDVLRHEFGTTPSQVRSRNEDRRPASGSLRLRLKLPSTEPYDADALLAWHSARAVAGLEHFERDRMTRVLPTESGPVAVRARVTPTGWIVHLELPEPSALGPVVATLRGWLDLDADVRQIGSGLAGDAFLAPMVRRRPGLRVPVWPDAWEGVMRTVIGQQVSVAAAATLTARVVAEHGAESPVDGLRTFPAPQALAAATLAYLPRRRAATVRRLAELVASGVDPATAAGHRELSAVAGVGPWTTQYWRLRVLGDPDAWPGTDLVLRRMRAGLDPGRWQPWRAYAAQYLWTAAAERAADKREGK